MDLKIKKITDTCADVGFFKKKVSTLESKFESLKEQQKLELE
jgi:hypothetical protein